MGEAKEQSHIVGAHHACAAEHGRSQDRSTISRFSTTLELPTYVTFGKYKLYMPVIRYICVFVILDNYFR